MSSIAWRGKMKQDMNSGLWVRANSDDIAKDIKASKFRKGIWRRGKKRTIYNAYGRPICEVRVSDFGNSEHEYDDHQDAVARPDPVSLSAQLGSKDAAREALSVDSVLEAKSLAEAQLAFSKAKQAYASRPGHPETQALWARAKSDLKVSQLRQQLLSGG